MAGLLSGSRVRLDMTPMVDVAFLLLIFFMSTTSLKVQDDASITLPTSHAENAVPDKDRAVVTVHADGSVTFATERQKGVPVAAAEVGARVAAVQAQFPATRLVVFADGGVAYGKMNEVISSLQQAGITRFSLVTDVEEG